MFVCVESLHTDSESGKMRVDFFYSKINVCFNANHPQIVQQRQRGIKIVG